MTIAVGSLAVLEDDVEWSIPAGATSTWHLDLWQDDAATEPTDLSGLAGRCQLRTKAAGELLAEAVVTISSGTVKVTLPATASEGWTAKTTKGVFDVELYDPTNPDDVARLCGGSLLIAPNITTQGA